MKKKKKKLICCYLLILQPLSFKQFMLVGTGNPGKFGHKRLAEIHRGADSHCSKTISALLPNKVKPPHPTDLTQKQPRLTDRNWLPSPVQKALPSLPACWGARGSVWNREGYQSGPYFLFLVAQMWRCFAAEELAVGGEAHNFNKVSFPCSGNTALACDSCWVRMIGGVLWLLYNMALSHLCLTQTPSRLPAHMFSRLMLFGRRAGIRCLKYHRCVVDFFSWAHFARQSAPVVWSSAARSPSLRITFKKSYALPSCGL